VTARFILSLDCEGKWGVADHLTPADHAGLSDERLRQAYGDILSLLDEFDLPATFAFVGCFSLSAKALADMKSDLKGAYVAPAIADAFGGSRQGWTGDWALEATQAARAGHEIGLHGVTHTPWDQLDEAGARAEMALLYGSGAPMLRQLTTWIYPRNAQAHEAVLDEFGLAGLREERPSGSRAIRLLSEFNLWSPPDRGGAAGRPLRIPPGYFVNWRSGARRTVPVAVSVERARRMLVTAARTGGVVHYWTHPENIATAPETLAVLRGIVEAAARARDAGQCEVLTQDAYCRTIDPGHVAACEARRNALLKA
jgi:peptidoglycan/xylan/chitin deacetylase (PgdA/CDA1 family)